jgi:hypothetical protein
MLNVVCYDGLKTVGGREGGASRELYAAGICEGLDWGVTTTAAAAVAVAEVLLLLVLVLVGCTCVYSAALSACARALFKHQTYSTRTHD